jgi:hypothetical protein
MTMPQAIDTRLCPPLFAVQALRVDSPTSNRADSYKCDAEFFKKQPERRFNIRPALFNEFDVVETMNEWLQLPPLHVLVTQVVTGVHFVTPTWRGRLFYAEVSTDSELAMILSEMNRRGGIDRAALDTFTRMFNFMLKAPESVN